jgi:hypothetical protein
MSITARHMVIFGSAMFGANSVISIMYLIEHNTNMASLFAIITFLWLLMTIVWVYNEREDSGGSS